MINIGSPQGRELGSRCESEIFFTVYSFTLSEFQSLWMYHLSKSFQLKIKIKGEKVFTCSGFLWDGGG